VTRFVAIQQENSRVDQDRQDGTAQDQVARHRREQVQRQAEVARMKENSPICARLAEMVSAVEFG
jgi:hypothetical protein